MPTATEVGARWPRPPRPGDAPALTGWRLDPKLSHLNHGSYGAVPTTALDHQDRLRAEMEQAPVRWFSRLPARVRDAANRCAALVGAPPERTAFVGNASAGISVAMSCLPLPAGAEIVVTDHGYGAALGSARRAAERAGARVVTVTVPLSADDDEIVATVTGAFTDRTAILLVDQITSATTRRFPVERLCAAARACGIHSVVDGAHAPGLERAPLDGLDADVWVGNLHKFMCAPRGTALLVAAPRVADRLWPVVDSWGMDLPFPQRFDHQGTADLTAWLAAPTAADWIGATYGWDVVRDYSRRFAAAAAQHVAEAFEAVAGYDATVTLPGPAGPMRLVRLPPGVAATHPDADALRPVMHERFGLETGFTSFHGTGYVRFSAHAYSTSRDVERFVQHAVPYLAGLARSSRPSQPPLAQRSIP